MQLTTHERKEILSLRSGQRVPGALNLWSGPKACYAAILGGINAAILGGIRGDERKVGSKADLAGGTPAPQLPC
jgi:hypothetical protein